MTRKRNHNRNKKLRNGKMKTSNSNANKQNEKPERTDDSGTPSQDDSEVYMDGERTNDIAMTQSNNDQTTPEEDQPKHMERRTESIGINGEKTVVGVSPSQSFQTGDIKDDQMHGTEERHQHGHVDETEERHQHVDGTEEQHQHRHVNSDVEQQNGQVDNDSTNTEADYNEHETMSHVNGEKTAVDVGPSQSFQIGDIKQDQMDGAEVRHQHGHVDASEERHQHEQVDGTEERHQHRHVDGIEEQPQHRHVDGTEEQAQHGHVEIDVDQQNGQVDNDSTGTETENNGDETMSLVNGEKTAVDVGPSQSIQTGDIKDDQMDGTEERHHHGHVGRTEEQHQHGHVDQQNGQVDNDSTSTQTEKSEDETMSHVNGEKTVVDVGPSQSLQTGDIKDDQMDWTKERHHYGQVDGTEERHHHGHVDQQNGQVDNASTSTETENSEDETMSHVNGEKTAVDVGPSQSLQTGDIKDDQMDGTEERHHHGHVDIGVDQQNGQVDNDSTNTEADNNEHETMSHVNGEKTGVDDGSSQSFQNGDIKHDEMDGAEVQQQHGHVDGTEEQAQHGPVDMGVDQQIRQVDNDSTCTETENNEDETMSLINGEKTAVDVGPSQSLQTEDIKDDQMDGTEERHQHRHVDGTEEQHQHGHVDQQNEQIDNDSTTTGTENSEDETMSLVNGEKTAVDVGPSQSLQTGDIKDDQMDGTEEQHHHGHMDWTEERHHHGHVDQQNGQMSLYENEAENDNAVDADNFENEIDSPQSSESGNDMAHYEGSNETLSYNLLSDIQLKTSQEKEIEKLQRELNIKNENLATLKEEMKRRDEIINEKNSENADLLHRCVASETSAEAADDLREQCEDKNHQIETLEGDLASVRYEKESLKRHLEEIENVAADHQRLIDENKSLDEYLEQERQSSAALKEETQALKEQITNNEDVLKEFESQIKKAIEEKEELGAKLASRNENNSDLLSNYLEMKKKEEEMAAELKKMQENYQHEKRRSEELSDQLSLRNKEVITTENKYKQEIEELKAKYKTEKDQAEKEKELLKQCVTKLNEGSQQLQAENKRIKDDLQLKSKECGNLKSERLRITGELDAAKKEIAELSNERDKLGAYITTVNDEVRQLRAALELKEAEKNAANECMQKVVREKQEMMYSMGNLQRIELENHRLKHQNMDQSEQITKLHASLQEYGLLRDHIQEYYKALQDSQMELQREKEKSRHINELLSKTGYRLDLMASELNNYRTMTEGYRRSLEEEKEKSNKLEQKFDRLTIDNEKLKEERDKCEQKSFEYRDECSSLPENLEKSQAECRDLLSKTQEGPSDGTTSLLQGNFHFTSTPMGNGFGNPSSQSKFVLGFGNPSSQSKFVLGIGRDKMNRKK